MSTMENPKTELDALRAQIDALARGEEQLHAQLFAARTDMVQRESAIASELGELRATLEQHRSVPSAPETEGQRVSNKYIAYQQLIGRIREVAYNTLPREAVVLVASRGDEDLVQL